MTGRIFVLQVGINDYPSHVGKLSGCLNDVSHFREFLDRHFGKNNLRVEQLLNADATRANIIRQFREHLGQAEAGDVAIFQYSGHGARWKSAAAFQKFYPEGKDEGLVCIDSREDDGYDLADKELAVLLAEVAAKNPHIAVILDSCHSGSATRGIDDFTQLRARQTHEVTDERPLDSYLDGYYAAQSERAIPASRHIVLAACERYQKAWEGRDQAGVFTSTLLEVLEKSGPDISYADLFVRCRAAIRRRVDFQEPQFEPYRGFNAYSGFLGNATSQGRRRYSVSFSKGTWQVGCGAIHGLPTDPDKSVALELYSESDTAQPVGHAVTSQVGAQNSELALDFPADQSVSYQAEITSLPVPPLAIALQGDAAGITELQRYLAKGADQSLGVTFLSDPTGTRYSLSAKDGCYLLHQTETEMLIQGAKGFDEAAAEYICQFVKSVAAWERTAQLQNKSTLMLTSDVQFVFRELLTEGKTFDYPDSQVTLGYRQQGGKWLNLEGLLMVNNCSDQTLHFALLYVTADYGVRSIYNEPAPPTAALFELLPGGQSPVTFDMDEGQDECSVHFKLIVSTEKVDAFLLEQDSIVLRDVIDPRSPKTTRGGAHFGRKVVHQNEWFTKDLHIRIVRQVGKLSTTDTPLAGNRITIKGHPSLQANASLNAVETATRSVGNSHDLCRILELQKMSLISLSGTRSGDDSVLEITDIRNPEVLEQKPLEIELDFPLEEGWGILPLAFNGEDILLVGDPSVGDDKRTRISISEIPELPDSRRSLGRAIKLYFFKTYLGVKNVNKLCRIEYKVDGRFERHDDVADKVASAKNIILLVHGIIGNTDSMVEGLRLAKDADGKSLDQKFDLVLTYDYENLSTPLPVTALDLKRQLAAAGLKEDDGRRLTLLVHSMGGLVSRWFIEREGGNKVVDHLVMFGTPNVGSPFGKVESARKLGGFLTTLAINALPALVPYGGALVYALNRSKKLTPTLEQMNPDSEFIASLNQSPDPGIPYTIVAGDIREYDPSTDAFVGRLLANVAQGLLFEVLYHKLGHDIAVSNDSIRGVAEARVPVPAKRTVVCHHLNYFSSPAGLAAMLDVAW